MKVLDIDGLEYYNSQIEEKYATIDSLDNYLPLTGGSITGNLSVSGTITGDVTGDLTGTATNATNDANGNPIASTYLPLSGGTMTGSGTIRYNGSNNKFATIQLDNNGTNIDIGWNWNDSHGAILGLRGVEYGSGGTDAGSFVLFARKSGASHYLTGFTGGDLVWTGNVRVGGYRISSNTSNNTGLLLLNGGYNDDTGGQILCVGQSFTNNAGAVILRPRTSSGYKELYAKPDGSLVWNNIDIGIAAKGSNYIRYNNGIQIYWGDIAYSASGTYTHTYSVAFNVTPKIAISVRWAAENEQVRIQDDSGSSFKIKATNSGTNSHNMFFIAIGTWK